MRIAAFILGLVAALSLGLQASADHCGVRLALEASSETSAAHTGAAVHDCPEMGASRAKSADRTGDDPSPIHPGETSDSACCCAVVLSGLILPTASGMPVGPVPAAALPSGETAVLAVEPTADPPPPRA